MAGTGSPGGSIGRASSFATTSAHAGRGKPGTHCSSNEGTTHMRRRLLAFVASAVLLPATAAGTAAADGPSVQDVGQSAGSQQSATSSASSTQVKPSNTNISVRIGSPGDDGAVSQTNSSKAVSVAGNKNTTDQSAGQSGGSGGVQNADQSAYNKQDATSDATSKQVHPSNVNIPVRIFSKGDDGSVT